jgi:hypothetical protein
VIRDKALGDFWRNAFQLCQDCKTADQFSRG